MKESGGKGLKKRTLRQVTYPELLVFVALGCWARFWLDLFLSVDDLPYAASLPAVLAKSVSGGRVRVSQALARKLAAYALWIWGEACLAREIDCDPKPDPMGKSKPVARGEREFVVASTLAMYTRVPSSEYRPGDDPPEAAFWYLQVESMLIGLESRSDETTLDPDQSEMLVRVLSGETLTRLSGRYRVPVPVIRDWCTDIEGRLRRALDSHCPAEAVQVERLYCEHRFVRGRACQAFPGGLEIERRLITVLAQQMRDTWGATIPVEVAREMYARSQVTRRRSWVAAGQTRRDKVKRLRDRVEEAA